MTKRRVNGFRVDFSRLELGLVVETDGLRYHRTPAQQAKDRLRDQRHAAAGLTPLRFTHAQVAFENPSRGGCSPAGRRAAARLKDSTGPYRFDPSVADLPGAGPARSSSDSPVTGRISTDTRPAAISAAASSRPSGRAPPRWRSR